MKDQAYKMKSQRISRKMMKCFLHWKLSNKMSQKPGILQQLTMNLIQNKFSLRLSRNILVQCYYLVKVTMRCLKKKRKNKTKFTCRSLKNGWTSITSITIIQSIHLVLSIYLILLTHCLHSLSQNQYLEGMNQILLYSIWELLMKIIVKKMKEITIIILFLTILAMGSKRLNKQKLLIK